MRPFVAGVLALTCAGGPRAAATRASLLRVELLGYRPMISVMKQDSEGRLREGDLSETLLDSGLSARFVPFADEPGPKLECGAGHCRMWIPCSTFDFCMPTLVMIEPSRARVQRPWPVQVPGELSFANANRQPVNGAWDVEFQLPDDLERPAEVIGVATSFPADQFNDAGFLSLQTPLQGLGRAALTNSVHLAPDRATR